MNTKIKWVADERELPGIGVAKPGDIITLPEHLAKSYVYQGLAAVYKQPKKEAAK